MKILGIVKVTQGKKSKTQLKPSYLNINFVSVECKCKSE